MRGDDLVLSGLRSGQANDRRLGGNANTFAHNDIDIATAIPRVWCVSRIASVLEDSANELSHESESARTEDTLAVPRLARMLVLRPHWKMALFCW